MVHTFVTSALGKCLQNLDQEFEASPKLHGKVKVSLCYMRLSQVQSQPMLHETVSDNNKSPGGGR